MVNNKVLIIDDEEVVIESIRKDINGSRFNMFSAMNGEDGLEKYRKVQPILIILDLRMPGMDGVEFLEQIKLKPYDPYTVIVLTGHGTDEDIKRCFDLGVSSFIRKPYNIDMLRGTVRNCISLKQMQQSMINEIDEREHAEKALRESEERLRAIIDNATAVIYLKDTQGRYILINRQYELLFHVSKKEIVGKTDYDLFPEDKAEAFQENDRKVIDVGTPLEFEEIVPHDDGLHTYISIKFPLFSPDGIIYGVCGISTDITEHKKMEEELTRIQKLESLGILAGGIAHDFNNYLQAIMNNIDLAMTHAISEDKIYQRLVEAKNVTLRTKNLTQQLLTFSKGGEPIKSTIFVSGLLRDAANFALSGSNVRCEFDISDDLCPVEVDKGQVGQVFNNLIINAVQAMPEGGTIKVLAENINIDLECNIPLKEGKYVKITVKDEGVGILQEHLQKIFDPYFTTKEQGSGLGLSTAYSIIIRHGGNVTVESEMGSGTTINIYLRSSQKKIVEKPVLGEDKMKDTEKAHLTCKGKVLLMDDEGIIRLSTCDLLENLKYEVETSKDGAKAIELFKNAIVSGKPFDAVILDLTIPGGMGGKDTIKKMLEIDPDVKAIVASGYSNDPVMANFKEYGFKGVLPKPYEIYELEEALQKVIMGIR